MRSDKHRRRSINRTMAVTALLTLGVSCSNGEQGTPVSSPPVDTISLSVIDSITGGTDTTECMFGAIERTMLLEDGGVLALDIARCCVFRFAPDGTYIGTIGSAGPGPGELGYPSDMTVMEDGTIAVSDPMKAAVLLYSLDSGYVGLIEGFPMTPMRNMQPAPGGGFIGWRSSVEMGEGEYLTHLTVGRWTTDGNPVTVYWDRSEPSDLSSFTSMLKQSLYAVAITADRDGRVFVAPLSTEEYTVQCYQPDGELFATIRLSLPRQLRSEEELQVESSQMETRMRSMGDHGMPMVWEPDPYRIMVGEMGTDADGRLWVRRGTADQPTFDVFDVPSGERLCSAVLDYHGDASGWIFSIQPGGMLAWSADADSCQSIYRLAPDSR